MLPFLKNRNKAQQTGIIVKERAPDQPEDQPESDGIDAVAQDLISAIHAKDSRGVADAIRAAFQIMEMEPHDEIEHEEQE